MKKYISKAWWILIIFLILIIAFSIVAYKITLKNQNKVTIENKQKLSQRKIIGLAIDKSSGSYIGGKDISIGSYDVTAINGDVFFTITGGLDNANAYVGKKLMVSSPKVRVKISNDDKILIQGETGIEKLHFEPVRTALIMSQKSQIFYAGNWFVGEDITKGKYRVVAINSTKKITMYKNNRTITTIDTNGTENLTIYDKNRFIKLNAVLKINNSNEIVSLQTGDVINVSGFNELKFVPID